MVKPGKPFVIRRLTYGIWFMASQNAKSASGRFYLPLRRHWFYPLSCS